MKNILSNTTEYPEKFREYVATILHEVTEHLFYKSRLTFISLGPTYGLS